MPVFSWSLPLRSCCRSSSRPAALPDPFIRRAMPGISGKIDYTLNRYGFRGPDVDLAKSRDLKILVVGGSTVECLYVTDGLSWPWRLQEKLSQRLRRPVAVEAAAQSGAFTLHHIAFLKNNLFVDKFNWVVILCGI